MNNHKSEISVDFKLTQQGFTLVELLLVILVLSSLALGASFLVDGFGDQMRFDDTKTRLQLIRKAIIGDTSRTLNGQAEISGYVADMGRLPVNLKELIELDGQSPWGLSEVTASDISPVVTISISAGWRGPYIDTLPESDGERRFRDGWGNGDLSDVDFGWQYSANDLSGVTVQSLGANGISEVTPENVFDADYPTTGFLINPNDYVVSLNNMSVHLSKPIETALGETDKLVLRIYYVIDEAITFEEAELAPQAMIGQQLLIFNFSATAYLGGYAAVLLCDIEMAPNLLVFDGNCDENADINNSPYYFKLIPRAQLPVIPWNIQ